ncbi:MAG: acyl-CoA dehydrogenase, partial [Myxococcota bacterium]
QKKNYLPGLADGSAIGTFALTEKAGQNDVENIQARVSGGKITGSKIPVAAGDVASFAVVAAEGESGLSLYLVDLDANGVERKSIRSFDPSRSMAQIEFDGAAADELGNDGDGAEMTSHVLDRAAVLMAFEQLGSAEACFDMTREFTLGRYAFGRPVASFQAIKHRLADMWCELELARSNAYYGAWALSEEEDELQQAACIARIQASEAFDQISVETVQMHGGVGYTWEYDCHLFYRRAKLLSAALGSPAAWKNKLVDRLEEDAD